MRLEKEAHTAYVNSRMAEVEKINEDLSNEYAEIDGLLAVTLDSDDWVDLETMKRTVQHPPFPRPDLQVPHQTPPRIEVPPPPVFREPEPPKGVFGKKRKLEEARQRAAFEHQQALHQWAAYRDSVPAQQASLDAQHAGYENDRRRQLQEEVARYEADCRAREAAVAEHNASLDALAAGLGYGSVEAVEEYIGIVLANSVYPETFDVQHETQFDPESAELRLRAIVPAPEDLRSVKAYRYVKASDEIVETQLSKKDANDRYAGALHQVALRSLHEIFEADRRGIIQAVSLQVGPQTKDPATGRSMFLPLVAVTSPREKFLEFDLSGVVPAATLQHLGAAVSKNPSALAVVDPSGVRRS